MAHSEISLLTGPGYFHGPVINGRPIRESASSCIGPKQVVFLDRDGVLIEDVHYLRRSNQLELLPNVSEALKLLVPNYRIIVVTNQSGISRGLFTEEDLLDIHTVLSQYLWTEGAYVDGFYFCPHHPTAPICKYRLNCRCRKPNPGMLWNANQDFDINLRRSYLVGDRLTDMEASEAAGLQGILVGARHNQSEHRYRSARDLLDAAQVILGI